MFIKIIKINNLNVAKQDKEVAYTSGLLLSIDCT